MRVCVISAPRTFGGLWVRVWRVIGTTGLREPHKCLFHRACLSFPNTSAATTMVMIYVNYAFGTLNYGKFGNACVAIQAFVEMRGMQEEASHFCVRDSRNRIYGVGQRHNETPPTSGMSHQCPFHSLTQLVRVMERKCSQNFHKTQVTSICNRCAKIFTQTVQ